MSLYSLIEASLTHPEKVITAIVLSEFKGLIVEVFEVKKWYPIKRQYNPGTKKAGQSYTGYGFDGNVAPHTIRNLYLNKSIAHKKNGSSNPIMYNL